MIANEVQLAQSIPIQPRPDWEDKWRLEQRAFFRLLGELLKSHRGQYVAIHNEQVVATGANLVEVALCAYALHGQQSIYVDLVDEHPLEAGRIPHYREPAANS